VSNSTYDALNRRTATTYADTTLNVAYGYDEPNSTTGCASSYPVGRLTRVIELNVTTVYCYDQRGNVIQKSQTQGTATDVTLYGYTPANRLASTVTAAGTSIQYSRDAAGRINGVTVLPPGTSGAGAGNVVTAVSYLPFGPIASYTLGNGQTITRSYDANYALTDIVSPALNLHFQRDAMGDITALGNAPGANPATETYTYDPLYRLIGMYNASGVVEEAYTYSKTGDRLSKTAAGLDSGTYSSQSGTHHLASIGNAARAYDANGNTTGSVVGGNTYGLGYNGRNRMTVAQLNSSTVGTYTYNALGQRMTRVATFPAAVNQRFVYDENSQLLSEYGSNTRDYIWLDNLPVAVVDTAGTTSNVSYVTGDGLSTPRAVSDSNGNTIWQLAYQGNPFGEQQPTSTAGFIYNLRSAGEYFDLESGTNYNVMRTRESATDRFLQSDPKGLAAGMNTYAAVANNPLGYVDPLGLVEWQGTMTGGGASAGVGGSFYTLVLDSECVHGKKAHVKIYAAGPTLGLNIKGTLPVGLTSSSITLNDGLDYLDPSVLNGWFAMYSAGGSLFKGGSCSMVQVGGNGRGLQRPADSGAWSGPSCGGESGIELGAGATAGSSTVVESVITDCGCDKQ
jgi:RHS repeat-associated protein